MLSLGSNSVSLPRFAVRRLDGWDVCAASLKRAEQSLRSLEEYGKLIGADFAGQCESLTQKSQAKDPTSQKKVQGQNSSDLFNPGHHIVNG